VAMQHFTMKETRSNVKGHFLTLITSGSHLSQIGLFRGSFALLPPSSPAFHFVGLCARQGKVSFYLIARLAAGGYGTFRNDCAIKNLVV